MPEDDQRKYALTKIRDGDYLLPSNDAQTLWRIARYDEDDNMRLTLWGLWRWDGGMPTGDQVAAALDEDMWTPRWEYWEGGYRTRAAAIAGALAREQAAAVREP